MSVWTVLCAVTSLCVTPTYFLNWNVTKNVPYGTAAPQEIADLYLLQKGLNPLVIMIHGGGWMGGDKSAYTNLAAQYANAGFSVMSINYTVSDGNPDTVWNVQLQDAQAAVRWIRLAAMKFNLHIDPNRIGVVGDSAGGHLALFLGSLSQSVRNSNPRGVDRSQQYAGISPKVQAVGDLFGPSDATTPEGQTLMSLTTVLGGATFQSNPQLFKDFSPVYSFNAQSAPTCFLHGTADTLVPVSQSIEAAGKLQSLGVPYRWFTYSGGHGFDGMTTAKVVSLNDNVIRCMAEFLHPDPRNAR